MSDIAHKRQNLQWYYQFEKDILKHRLFRWPLVWLLKERLVVKEYYYLYPHSYTQPCFLLVASQSAKYTYTVQHIKFVSPLHHPYYHVPGVISSSVSRYVWKETTLSFRHYTHLYNNSYGGKKHPYFLKHEAYYTIIVPCWWRNANIILIPHMLINSCSIKLYYLLQKKRENLTRTIKVEGMQQRTKFWVTLQTKISLLRYIE